MKTITNKVVESMDKFFKKVTILFCSVLALLH